MTEEVKKIIQDTIRETVNGKIDALRIEQSEANKKMQNEIYNVKIDVKEVLEAFRETSDFFKVSMRIARWIIAIGGAATILIWGRTKI